MKRTLLRALLAAVALVLADGWGAAEEDRPQIGYLSPAGGQVGTVVKIEIGGQRLRGANRVWVTGEGVRGTVVRFLPSPLRLNGDQLQELGKRLRDARTRLATAVLKEGRDPLRRPDRPARRDPPPKKEEPRKDGKKEDDKPAEPEVKLPEHPLLDKLDEMSLRELKKVADRFLDPVQRAQQNPQLAEIVEIEVTIDANAAPGVRELRLGTAIGVTAPFPFRVGLRPEAVEAEPNDFEPQPLPAPAPAFVLNGQVDHRDIDRFRFPAKKGQKLVFAAEARRIIPYLADAVPGWFQAVLVLRDAQGNEVGYVDDYRFDPDPVLFYEVPADGEYELEVRDSINRGREDFIYRVTIGEIPFVTRIFPLGGREGVETRVEAEGVNLPFRELTLETGPGGRFRETAGDGGRGGISNPVAYSVDDLPEVPEMEPNDTAGMPQPVGLPVIVNGRIGAPGDVDVFRFAGKAGDTVVVEVLGRRLGSPLDSVVRVADAAGKTLAMNDDREDPAAGLVTHQADSFLRFDLPADGAYVIRLEDAERHGGIEYGYRLRIAPPRPGYTVLVTPSVVNVPAGAVVPLAVRASREDGFDGDIELRLKSAPAGFVLSGGRIPAGREEVTVTLGAPANPPREPVRLEFEAVARVGDRVIVRPAVPAEDRMQAFGYRHLVQAKEFLAVVTRGGIGTAAIVVGGDDPIRIRPGATVSVPIRAPGLPRNADIRYELSNPPEGLTLRDVAFGPTGIMLYIHADAAKVKPGFSTNLIVQAWTETQVRGRGPNSTQTRRTTVGTLPAIPILVVE